LAGKELLPPPELAAPLELLELLLLPPQAARIAAALAPAMNATDSGSSVGARNLVLESRRDEIPRLPQWQIGVGLYLEARTRASVRGRDASR